MFRGAEAQGERAVPEQVLQFIEIVGDEGGLIGEEGGLGLGMYMRQIDIHGGTSCNRRRGAGFGHQGAGRSSQAM